MSGRAGATTVRLSVRGDLLDVSSDGSCDHRFKSDDAPSRGVPTSEEECLRALREAADRLGESPTKAQYEGLGLTPASATILRVMGGWNAAKEAAGLETYDRKEYGKGEVKPRPAGVEIPDDTDWAELSPNMRWYYKNRRRDIEKKERRRDRIRSWLREYKGECSCHRCGEDHPACLDFHHVDRSEKDRSVSRMVADGFARDRIREEIDECVVLCANCHRKEHATFGSGG
jgi:hypothetical protein